MHFLALQGEEIKKILSPRALARLFLHNMNKQNLTPDQALNKIKHYCAYQERSHSEVKEKLYGFGLHRNDVDELISLLIEENYLNEERFAIQFAGGRFRIKHWGRVKIRYELKQRQVSEYCIKEALASIDEDDYQKQLETLFEQKSKTLKGEKNLFVRKRKIQDHLMQKGYERELIVQLFGRS